MTVDDKRALDEMHTKLRILKSIIDTLRDELDLLVDRIHEMDERVSDIRYIQ